MGYKKKSKRKTAYSYGEGKKSAGVHNELEDFAMAQQHDDKQQETQHNKNKKNNDNWIYIGRKKFPI